MDSKYIRRSLIIGLISIIFLFSPTYLYAQENPEVVVELIERLSALEEENRQLRGQLEEAQHDVHILNQRMETLSADIEYRLASPEHTPLTPPASPPLAPAEEGPKALPGVTTTDTTTEAYENARNLLEQGEYEAAERAFASFVKAHPKDKFAGAAQYWLGVTYFVRGQHEKAVAAFAKGYKTYPKSLKAADTLLKLAKSLAALDRKADACTTLGQLATELPKAHTKEVASEKKKWGCK